MLDSLRDHHTELFATLFAAAVVAAAWLEVFFPRRPVTAPRSPRWVPNLSLGAVNAIFFTFAVPLSAFAVALIAEQHGWGALRLVPLPDWLSIPLGALALDLCVYLTHRLLHVVPALWRLHRVHHSDIDIDFTTTVRHHPIEAVVTLLMIFTAILVLGISPESVVIQQAAATVFDVTTHGNVRIPRRLDGWIRRVFVTPDMHVVHHSSLRRETDSNYGTVLSLWDRLLGTYVASPVGSLSGMTIGLEYYREPADQRLDRVLISPFTKPPSASLVGNQVSP